MGIDISEEIYQAGKATFGRMMPTGLGLQLANFTASTFGSMRSPPAPDAVDSTISSDSPTLPVPLSTSTAKDGRSSKYHSFYLRFQSISSWRTGATLIMGAI